MAQNKIIASNDIAIIVLPNEVEFPENSEVGSFWDDHTPDPKEARGTFVRPICMPDFVIENQVQVRPLHPWTFNNLIDGESDRLFITGFGRKHDDYEGKFTSAKELMKAYTSVMTNAKCQKSHRETTDRDMVISNKQLCAMGRPSEYPGMPVLESCHGDSGGPAVKFVNVVKEKAILEKL